MELYELIIKIGVGKKLDVYGNFIFIGSSYGMSLAYGVAVFVIGVTVSSAWKVEIERSISAGKIYLLKIIKLVLIPIVRLKDQIGC